MCVSLHYKGPQRVYQRMCDAASWVVIWDPLDIPTPALPQKSCDAQVAATLGNFTANGANNGSCVSLINATLTAPAAKDCPAPAKVQACFKVR